MEAPASSAWPQTANSHLQTLRRISPLIQCIITNYVSADLVANTLLSAGASPSMIHSLNETPHFYAPRAPHALYVNVETLSYEWLQVMIDAADVAVACGKPWVLDTVAVGSSSFWLKSCLKLVEKRPTVITGNESDIIALYRASSRHGKGADRYNKSTDATEAAKSLAQKSRATVVVTGAAVIITDGGRVVGALNGVPMMQKIAAIGCSLAALIAAFVAIDKKHPFEATASAISIFGIAGELGAELAKGPGSLRMHLLDSLYAMDEANVLARVNITTSS